MSLKNFRFKNKLEKDFFIFSINKNIMIDTILSLFNGHALDLSIIIDFANFKIQFTNENIQKPNLIHIVLY